jgi:ATP/maltotriose-dependent transcriptional regulator MalT
MNPDLPSSDVASAAVVAPPNLVPLVATKIRAPVLHGSHVGPERLDLQLDAALDEATRLAIVSAPPRYGESMAVLGWLRSQALPHAWLSFEPADNDPVRFVRYLSLRCGRCVRTPAGPRCR